MSIYVYWYQSNSSIYEIYLIMEQSFFFLPELVADLGAKLSCLPKWVVPLYNDHEHIDHIALLPLHSAVHISFHEQVGHIIFLPDQCILMLSDMHWYAMQNIYYAYMHYMQVGLSEAALHCHWLYAHWPGQVGHHIKFDSLKKKMNSPSQTFATINNRLIDIRHCPKLLELSLKGSGKVGDESVEDIATCPKLRLLDIQVLKFRL